VTVLPSAIKTFSKLAPVPRPAGRVTGNPADASAVVIDAQAGLPHEVLVAEQPLELAAGAEGLVVKTPPTGSLTISGEAPTVDAETRKD
jgi:hypothetical protein